MGYSMDDRKILEEKLYRKLWKHRIIEGLLIFAFAVLIVVCFSLREASKQIIVHDLGITKIEETVYNNSYVSGIVIGVIGAMTSLTILISDFLACDVTTIKADNYDITVYIGLIYRIFYVDGEEYGRLGLIGRCMEIELPNKVGVDFVFYKYGCHVSFTNGQKSINI